MIRQIITIDEDKCNGCGACAKACHENAIGMVNGKAKLLRDDYCDGLGDCLPSCPTDAISFINREADAYNEAAVIANKAAKMNVQGEPLPCGCPGMQSKSIIHNESDSTCHSDTSCDCNAESGFGTQISGVSLSSKLSQWPVQIKLAPINAPYFDNAKLLIAADCTAYAYGNFHNEYIKNRITLIGCPKLDDVDYSEKLTTIIANNNIKDITVVRMEVPCCGGIEMAVKKALQDSGKFIPWQVITISTDGKILD